VTDDRLADWNAELRDHKAYLQEQIDRFAPVTDPPPVDPLNPYDMPVCKCGKVCNCFEGGMCTACRDAEYERFCDLENRLKAQEERERIERFEDD
jgi:hypothetical protein